MLNKELSLIEKRFRKFIQSNKISKPKPAKQQFFRKKAESSLQLAKELILNYHDWTINISYYSMFYNATTLLASIGVDLGKIDESTHVITYQALVFYFYIQKKKIEEQYLEDFKETMEQSDQRLMTLARQKSTEILSSYHNAKEERAKITYELGKTAEKRSAETAIRRAESFDRLTEKLLFRK